MAMQHIRESPSASHVMKKSAWNECQFATSTELMKFYLHSADVTMAHFSSQISSLTHRFHIMGTDFKPTGHFWVYNGVGGQVLSTLSNLKPTRKKMNPTISNWKSLCRTRFLYKKWASVASIDVEKFQMPICSWNWNLRVPNDWTASYCTSYTDIL